MLELNDLRPRFRVASFGLPETMQRVAEIVFSHARHNPYRYQVTSGGRLDQCDVALVDMTVQGNERLLRVLRRRTADLVVLTVGRRGAASRKADDLLLTQFPTRLLAVLNQAVARRVASPIQSSLSFASPPTGGPALSAVAAVREAWSRSPRALILDASAGARVQLMTRLVGAGWEVQGASTLSQARAWLSAWPVDLMISDWMLEDGPASQLRSARLAANDLQGGPSCWVLLTRHLGWWDALQARRAGCAGVLDKPATPQAMLALADRLLRERLERRLT